MSPFKFVKLSSTIIIVFIVCGIPPTPSLAKTANQLSDADNESLATLWMQLCGQQERSSSQEDSQEPLQEALIRQLVSGIVPSDSNSKLTSLTCEEMAAPDNDPGGNNNLLVDSQPSASARVSVDNDEDMLALPKKRSDTSEQEPIQQVIFIQVPEETVQEQLRLSISMPRTVVYVLPPKEEKHIIKITDLRENRQSFNPSVNYLNGDYFGNDKTARFDRGAGFNPYFERAPGRERNRHQYYYNGGGVRYPRTPAASNFRHYGVAQQPIRPSNSFEIIPATYLGYSHFIE